MADAGLEMGDVPAAVVLIAAQVTAKTDEIRAFKRASPPGDRSALMSLVEELKELRAQYENVAGEPWGSKGAGARRARARAKEVAAQPQRLSPVGAPAQAAAELSTAASVDIMAIQEAAAQPPPAAAEPARAMPPGTMCTDEDERCYSATAHPQNRQNVNLYRNRFRPAGALTSGGSSMTTLACVSRQQHFRNMYANTPPSPPQHLSWMSPAYPWGIYA
eukprot:COSAG05_NODE_1099_length_5888_cov_9.758335_2_plen_219_part_00